MKAAAVRRCVTSELPYRVVPEEFGASIWAIRSWVQKAAQDPEQAEDERMTDRPDDRSPTVFGRLGSRPLNMEEMQKLYLDKNGKPWFVEN